MMGSGCGQVFWGREKPWVGMGGRRQGGSMPRRKMYRILVRRVGKEMYNLFITITMSPQPDNPKTTHTPLSDLFSRAKKKAAKFSQPHRDCLSNFHRKRLHLFTHSLTPKQSKFPKPNIKLTPPTGGKKEPQGLSRPQHHHTSLARPLSDLKCNITIRQ